MPHDPQKDALPENSVLFVCTGNICRSPTAEAVFRAQVQAAGLGDQIHIESAGTHDYHAGDPPDHRARQAAAARGYDMSDLRARALRPTDYRDFALLLAMDQGHLALMMRDCPPDVQDRLKLFMDYAPGAPEDAVPDPYYGGADGFEHVLDLVEAGAAGLLRSMTQAPKTDYSGNG